MTMPPLNEFRASMRASIESISRCCMRRERVSCCEKGTSHTPKRVVCKYLFVWMCDTSTSHTLFILVVKSSPCCKTCYWTYQAALSLRPLKPFLGCSLPQAPVHSGQTYIRGLVQQDDVRAFPRHQRQDHARTLSSGKGTVLMHKDKETVTRLDSGQGAYRESKQCIKPTPKIALQLCIQ
jgi:hypothetical protein